MPPIAVRPATAADQPVIVDIIRAARINPMDLKWPNFVVAVDQATGQIVGTGQVKSHGDGTRELASIATVPAYQKQGIAGQVIETLLAMHPGVLYLTCMSYLGPFYERFGFSEVPQAELTPYFRRLARVAHAFLFVNRRNERLLVMKHTDSKAGTGSLA